MCVCTVRERTNMEKRPANETLLAFLVQLIESTPSDLLERGQTWKNMSAQDCVTRERKTCVCEGMATNEVCWKEEIFFFCESMSAQDCVTLFG